LVREQIEYIGGWKVNFRRRLLPNLAIFQWKKGLVSIYSSLLKNFEALSKFQGKYLKKLQLQSASNDRKKAT
jgi:hypothetical protein